MIWMWWLQVVQQDIPGPSGIESIFTWILGIVVTITIPTLFGLLIASYNSRINRAEIREDRAVVELTKQADAINRLTDAVRELTFVVKERDRRS